MLENNRQNTRLKYKSWFHIILSEEIIFVTLLHYLYTEQMRIVVQLLTLVRYVTDSNSGWDAGYPDNFLMIFVSPSGKFRDRSLIRLWSFPLKILTNSPYTHYSTIRANIVENVSILK